MYYGLNEGEARHADNLGGAMRGGCAVNSKIIILRFERMIRKEDLYRSDISDILMMMIMCCIHVCSTFDIR